MSRLRVLTPREASIFACVCDSVVAPEPALPAVRDTDAVEAFDRMLAASPRLNALGLRALLYTAELAPRLLGAGGRLRRLPRQRRSALAARAETSARPEVRRLAQALRSLAFLSYYGDDAVMVRLGYDAGERVATGRRLRAEDGRP